jgi:hypothetical protein
MHIAAKNSLTIVTMASRQRGPKPSESLIDPAYFHKCDYQTSNSSAFADPKIVYSKTYKERTVPELQHDLRSKPLLTETSYEFTARVRLIGHALTSLVHAVIKLITTANRVKLMRGSRANLRASWTSQAG